MVPVEGLFEVHLTVSDLDRAIAMLGLWTPGSGPQRMSLHTAFRVSLADVMAAPPRLRSAGITPLDFDGRPTEQPVVIAWMPAASVFFRDPDGHLLEYIAILPHEPRPECGIVPWPAWLASAPGIAVSRHRYTRLQELMT